MLKDPNLEHGGRLTPGVELTVEKRDALADSVVVRAGDRNAITLGTSAAAKILVETI